MNFGSEVSFSPTTTQAVCTRRVNRLCQPVQCQKSAVNIMMDVDRASGAAKRRRERRLRSCWRHEAQSVAAALASSRHHSAGPPVVTWCEEVERESHVGLWAPMPPPPGTRPVQLPAAPGPQREAATVGYAAAGVPCLTPVVTGQKAARGRQHRCLAARALAGGATTGGGGGAGCGRAGPVGGAAAGGGPAVNE